jgi:hypothetical protein
VLGQVPELVLVLVQERVLAQELELREQSRHRNQRRQ